MSHTGILHHLLHKVLQDHFASDYQRMALAIGCSVEDLELALSAEGHRRSADIFERTSAYCTEHHISLDSMLNGFQIE